MKRNRKHKTLIFNVLLIFCTQKAFANENKQEHSAHEKVHIAENNQAFNIGEMIMHHISDAHQIHFLTLNEHTEKERHLSINLPIFLWDNGLRIFSSSKFYEHPHHQEHLKSHGYKHGEYIMVDEKIYKTNPNGNLTLREDGTIDASNLVPTDLSITKSGLGFIISCLLVLLLFSRVANKGKENKGKAPSGIQSIMEPMILLVKDQIVVPSMGVDRARRFLPFLLSVFFIIWIANLLGLVPFLGGFNIMGTMGVTMVLATLVFIITTIRGNKHYWMHILWPSGVPSFVKFILVPIEILGIFIKPVVLMIRLTANITAGHIIILAFTGLVIMMGQNSNLAGFGTGIGATLFMVFMFAIELLVAFLQAYVFTLLAALYFADATQEGHH
ncbi:MAG: F0F1 ATP synthase subunit A [Bacteroidota bacterium]|nr:F0F1 ATP synthase subunit A [Bacteroidota bacterium]